MFALHKIRPVFDFRRMATPVIVGAITLMLGACAHNTGNAGPSMYAVESTPLADDTVESSPIDPPHSEASEQSAAAPACGHGDASGWSDNCYVYRGGRDPVTGRASTQL